MNDPREPVYRKRGKRYIPCGMLNSGLDYDSFNAPGLWLHAESDGGGIRSMTLIAKLDELPSSAVAFGAIAQHRDELTRLLTDMHTRGISRYETAHEILKWISGKAGE